MTLMDINSLKDNLGNPARTYLWEVMFSNPLGGDVKTLLLRCNSTTIPGVSVGTIPIPFKQTGGIVVPGKKTYSHTWSCTFVEGEDRAMWDAFYAMAQSIVDDVTGIGSLFVKRDIYLHLINKDGTVSKKIRMIGCFVQSQDDVTMSYDDNTVVNINVTFSYDYWTEA